jgi:hypothetical protein
MHFFRAKENGVTHRIDATVRRSTQAILAPDDQKERKMYLSFETNEAV